MKTTDEDETMSKLGVSEGTNQEELEKRAASGCPGCGMAAARLIRDGHTVRCPNCGSAPFESRA